MKRKNLIIMAALLLSALILRVIQVFTVIEAKTGFYNRGSDTVGTVLTVLVFGFCFAGAIFARNAFKIEKSTAVPLITLPSCLLGAALLFEVFAETFANESMGWQVLFMKSLGVLAAVYFIALGFVKMPDICHIVPALYMIMRIICSFINIASLSLIAENVLYTAALCCSLLFFVSYAAHNCLEENKGNSLNFRAVLAASLCFVTVISNIIAEIFSKGGYNHIPLYSQFVMLAVSLFIGWFTVLKVVKSNKE